MPGANSQTTTLQSPTASKKPIDHELMKAHGKSYQETGKSNPSVMNFDNIFI